MPYRGSEKEKETQRLYRLKHKEKRSAYQKQYGKERYQRMKDDPQEQKRCRIKGWKTQGLIDDYERIHAIWIETTACMKCEKEISGRGKCMDHDHITGLYREILCRACNNGNVLDLAPTNRNKLQEKYISPSGNRFRFKKETGDDIHSEIFDSLAEAIKYRDEYIDGLGKRNNVDLGKAYRSLG